MSIDIACRHCGRVIFAPEEFVGKDLICPGCEKPVRVFRPQKDVGPAEEPIPVACPNCDASIRLVPKLLGRRVSCNTCGTVLKVTMTLKEAEESGITSQEQIRQDFGHEDEHPKTEESACHPSEAHEERHPISPPPLPLPDDSDYLAEPHEVDLDPAELEDEHPEPHQDLVFGLPEVAESPFPSSPPHWNSEEVGSQAQETSQAFPDHDGVYSQAVGDLELSPPEATEALYPTGATSSGILQAGTRTQTKPSTDRSAIEPEEDYSQPSEGFELDFPENSVASSECAHDAATADSPPLTRHEATLALRDKEIGAALRRIQSGDYEPEVEEPVAETATSPSHAVSTSDETPPWLWPLITATAATCAMVATLYYILYVL